MTRHLSGAPPGKEEWLAFRKSQLTIAITCVNRYIGCRPAGRPSWNGSLSSSSGWWPPPPVRPVDAREDSGELREEFGSECEKPCGDKALTPGAEIPERLARPR